MILHPAGRASLAVIAVSLLLFSGLAPVFAQQSASSPGGDIKSATPQRGVERPDHDGPYVNGTVIERFRGTTKLYSINLKIYYPATSAGTDTPADPSGAPYPTILMMPYAGGDETAYDFVAPRLVSWGIIIVCVGQNQADSKSGNETDVNDILDQLERDNATSGHRLFGMVNKGAYGISGHSRGGAFSVIDGWSVPRLRAVQAMAPALSQPDVDKIAKTFSKPFQVQVGRLDSSFWEISLYAYRSFKAPKGALDLVNTGHGGPFYWDLAISFFFRYLLGLTEYERFLYGEQAIDDAANASYFLNFTLPDGSFFPPNITVRASDLSLDEDAPVSFSLSYEGALPLGHLRSNFTWDFSSDGYIDQRDIRSLLANTTYRRAGITTVTAQFELGGLVIGTNNTLWLDVRNPPPAVKVGGGLSTVEDSNITLQAEGNDTPSDLPSLQYVWDFGDGAMAKAASASHAYKRSGNYTATVTVRDDEGAEGRATVIVVVSNLPPTASAGGDILADMDSEVALSGAGADTPSDQTDLRYRWDFGDSISSEWSVEPGALHTYTSAGRFIAVLQVMDEDGAAGQSSINVTVRNLPPTATATAPRPGASVQKDEELELTGAGWDTASDRPTLQYSWDFGDGNVSGWAPSARAVHTYTRGGACTAVLSVRDRAGAVARSQVAFAIVNQPPTVKISAPIAGDFEEDSPVRFSAQGTDTTSDRGLLAYSWAIDGKVRSAQTVEATFTTEGTHDFSVTVTDPEGASATAKGTVFIGNPAPDLSASLEPGHIRIFEKVNYSASAEDTVSDLGALSFSWDFGDGATASDPSGTHAYKRAGTFTVKVTVQDDEGARDAQSFTVFVDEPEVPHTPSGDGAPAPAPPLSGPAAVALAACAAVAAAAALFLWRRRRQA